MTRDGLLEPLRRHLSDRGSITDIVPLSSGHSSETYLVTGAELVLRMPPSVAPLFGPYYAAVEDQYAVLAELGARPDAPPVPVVRELCTDETVLGVPFMLMERVDGEAFERDLPPWVADGGPEVRASICRQYVEAFSRTHSLAPLECLGPSRTTLDEWGRWRHLAELARSPGVVALFDELLTADPRSSGPPTVVHGDAKLANLLWRDGRLQAVVDWETAFNGDPLNDLGYMLGFFARGDHPAYLGYDLPGMWSSERVVVEWEERTGRVARDLDLHLAAGVAKVAAIMAYGVRLFEDGETADERFGRWGAALAVQVDKARSTLMRS